MGLPPTSTKGSGDSTPVTTFRIDSPNIPITHSGTTATIGTVSVAGGGTGQTSYTDGQLLIGNSSGNTLTKASLTAGSNITITPGNGSISIAASGGGSGAWISAQTLTRVTATPTALGEYRSKFKATNSRSFAGGTDTAPSAAPSSSDGYKLFADAYNAVGTSGEANFYQVFIGSNKTVDAYFWNATGKTGQCLVDVTVLSGTDGFGVYWGYDNATGVVFVSAATWPSSVTSANCGWGQDNGDTFTVCYFDIRYS